MVAQFPEGLRPGQRARGGDGKDEHQAVAAAPGLPRVRDQHRQQAGDFPVPFLIMLVAAVIRACGTVPAAFRSGLIWLRHPQSNRRKAALANHPNRCCQHRSPASRHSPLVKSGTRTLVAALGYITPTRRSRAEGWGLLTGHHRGQKLGR